MMKNFFLSTALMLPFTVFAQTAQGGISNAKMAGIPSFTQLISASPGLVSKHNDIPVLIPKQKNGKYGYVNQNGKYIIQPEYYIAMFFSEDCNLLNSSNEKVKKFGTNEYATVEKNSISYRINHNGEKVYQYKDADLGKCAKTFVKQKYSAYNLKSAYGVIENSKKITNTNDRTQFAIYPQYDLIHVLEGSDVNHPMMIAVLNDKFGVINIENKIIVPFEYADIKRNFSWKMGGMFEVSKDGKTYKYIDIRNQSY